MNHYGNKHWEEYHLQDCTWTHRKTCPLLTALNTMAGGGKDGGGTMACFPLCSVFGAYSISMSKEDNSDELLGLGAFLEMQPPPRAPCQLLFHMIRCASRSCVHPAARSFQNMKRPRNARSLDRNWRRLLARGQKVFTWSLYDLAWVLAEVGGSLSNPLPSPGPSDPLLMQNGFYPTCTPGYPDCRLQSV